MSKLHSRRIRYVFICVSLLFILGCQNKQHGKNTCELKLSKPLNLDHFNDYMIEKEWKYHVSKVLDTCFIAEENKVNFPMKMEFIVDSIENINKEEKLFSGLIVEIDEKGVTKYLKPYTIPIRNDFDKIRVYFSGESKKNIDFLLITFLWIVS